MATLTVEKDRAIVNGDYVAKNGFTSAVRALDGNNFEEGDIFQIPKDFEVFVDSRLTRDPEKPVQYTFVQMLDKSGKPVENAKRLFPSSLCKTVFIWAKDENGELVSTGKSVKSSGNVIAEVATYAKMQDAMTAIAGKPMKITKIKRVQTRNFERDDLTNANVMTIDFV